MAKLTIGRYIIKPDIGSSGWVLARPRQNPTERHAHDAIGYYPRITDALDRLLDERMKESTATSVPELIAEIGAFRNEMYNDLGATVELPDAAMKALATLEHPPAGAAPADGIGGNASSPEAADAPRPATEQKNP